MNIDSLHKLRRAEQGTRFYRAEPSLRDQSEETVSE